VELHGVGALVPNSIETLIFGLFYFPQDLFNLPFPVARYWVTIEVPPLEKGVRGILRSSFSSEYPVSLLRGSLFVLTSN